MLDLLFSFRGRVGRLKYFLTVIGLAVAMAALVVGLVAMTVAGKAAGGHPDLLSILMIVLLVLMMVPVMIWSGLALQAKRIRDIGLDPVIVIPASLFFNICDAMVVQAAPQFAVIHGSHQTLLGAGFGLAFGLCLLFWPGKSDTDFELPSDASPKPPRGGRDPSRKAAVATRPVATQPAAAWSAASAPRTTFGRRGL